MVWFHGGGMRSGWSGSILYDGAELARKHDVVVVGVNHRLTYLVSSIWLGQASIDTPGQVIWVRLTSSQRSNGSGTMQPRSAATRRM